MARLSKAQLSKLSPAERAARAKRLEYNRRYDAMKKKTTVAHRKAGRPAKIDARMTADPFARAETLFSELQDVRKKEVSLKNEILSILKSV